MAELTDKQRAALTRFRELCDEIDELTLRPGETPLFEAVQSQARERLDELKADQHQRRPE